MNHGRTVLAQVLSGLHPEQFRRCADLHPMARKTPALSAYDHFAVMVFAQLTYRESLRDIEACLNSRFALLYHSGISSRLLSGNGVAARTLTAYRLPDQPRKRFQRDGARHRLQLLVPSTGNDASVPCPKR
jgi:hypothetical protein